MVKLVTVLERQVCVKCNGKGANGNGQSCRFCNSTGTVEVEVLR